MEQKYSRNVIITFFMISTFAIGMTEYVVTGLLTQFADEFDVPVSTTGLLLSSYAIGVAIFGPLLRVVTIKFSPKPLLIGMMVLFILSNVMAAMAPTFNIMILPRLCSATMHAPFFGLCMSMAMNISPADKRPAAIATVNGGLTIAVMLGVPFGSFIGGMFNWRYVFWFIVGIGLISLIGLLIVTPNLKPAEPPKLKGELQIFKNKSVMLVIAIIVFGFSGVFTAYTFLEPMLRYITGFGVTGVTISMLFFGIGAVIGNFASGRIMPYKLTERLIFVLIGLTIVLALFTTLIQSSALAFVMAFLFGVGTFGTTPILNAKIIIGAREAPALSGTIAASVFNLANAIGAMIGTGLLQAGAGYTLITLTASAIILFGLFLAYVTNKLEDKTLFE
ncbi:MAG TPA: MFS transporter [Virgibacillus sp.]|nr:MFS transporter [Virgibacillus sp.]